MSQSQIQQFKQFMEKHPEIIKEIRRGNKQLQDVYEQYILLGEEDPVWEAYKKTNQHTSEKDSNQLYQKLWKQVEQLDIDKVEEHIHQLNGAIHQIIKLINEFKKYQQDHNKGAKDYFFHPYD